MKYLKINIIAVLISFTIAYYQIQLNNAIAIFAFSLGLYLSAFQIVSVVWHCVPALINTDQKLDAETLNILVSVGIFTLLFLAYIYITNV